VSEVVSAPFPRDAANAILNIMSARTLFHSLSFDDVERAMAFLTAVGFTEAAVYRDESDPSRVAHAQYNWRDTGGVMFESRRTGSSEGLVDSVGHGQCYCVLESDADVDRVYDAGSPPARRRPWRPRTRTTAAATAPCVTPRATSGVSGPIRASSPRLRRS